MKSFADNKLRKKSAKEEESQRKSDRDKRRREESKKKKMMLEENKTDKGRREDRLRLHEQKMLKKFQELRELNQLLDQSRRLLEVNASHVLKSKKIHLPSR